MTEQMCSATIQYGDTPKIGCSMPSGHSLAHRDRLAKLVWTDPWAQKPTTYPVCGTHGWRLDLRPCPECP